MAQRYLFFNSVNDDRRIYQAQDFADYFGSVLSTGLLHNDNVPGLEVSVETGTMNTVVDAGSAIMRGHLYINDTTHTLTHALAEPTADRIDRVVLRLDLRNAHRNILLHIKEGVPDSNPEPPELQRDAFIYELSLAQVRIRANTSTIDQSDVTDERLDDDVCGLVYSLLGNSYLQSQIDDIDSQLTQKANQSDFDDLRNTSEIVESGSNSNGEYIRWANGWQICYNTQFRLTRGANANLQREWVFPASFSKVPHIGANTLFHDNNGLNTREATPVYVTARSSTGGTLIIRSLQDFTSGSYAHVSVFALGWWK